MLRDLDVRRRRLKSAWAGADWKEWISSPRRALILAAAVALAGLFVGYVITAIFLLPSGGIAGELTEVPTLVGRSRADARERVERAGLTYEETPGLPHPEPEGRVIAQEPLPGQVTEPGAAVRVTLSLGPRRRMVPDVVGLSQEQAQAALKGEGFGTDLVWSDARADVGEVIGVEPEPGTVVTLPATIRVLASAGARRVRVPDLLDASLAEARATLQRLGLEVGEVRKDYSAITGPNTVIGQSPQAGAEVERGATVAVTVAEEPPAGFTPADLVESRDTSALPDTVPTEGDGDSGG